MHFFQAQYDICISASGRYRRLSSRGTPAWTDSRSPRKAHSRPHQHQSFWGDSQEEQARQMAADLNLSAPEGSSINAGVQPDNCSLSYTSVDEVARGIRECGRGAEMAKINIKSAYRNIPVHPDDRHLFGMQWRGDLYADATLPFGLRSAPKIFNAVADALEWILKARSPLCLPLSGRLHRAWCPRLR